MKAILYKDLMQLRHNTAMLAVAIIGIVMSTSLVMLIPLTGMDSTTATTVYRFATVALAMCLAPTMSSDAIRDDLANGVVLSVRACGRSLYQYLAAQFVYALVPITVLSLAMTAVSYLSAPTLRIFIASPQGTATALIPTLAALAMTLWSILIKGKAMIMTATTLSSIPTSTSPTVLPPSAESPTLPADDVTASDVVSATHISPAPTAVRVTDMTFGYRRNQPVLEHIDLEVPTGQSLGILGYNGVGKTTLFGVITGLLRPRLGSAAINADVFHSMREVFQLTDSGNLSANMTVRENLKFRAMLYATRDDPHPIDLKHLDELPMVRAFELQDHLDKKVGDLSSGLRKRAGIVAGMLFDPKLILLDEPTNAVDPITRQLLIDLMRQLKEDGRTILTITHDLDYCWQVVDRVVILDDRHLVKDVMLADFPDVDAFKRAATLGRERDRVDFGLGGPGVAAGAGTDMTAATPVTTTTIGGKTDR